MQHLTFAQKGIILNKKLDQILVSKFLDSKFLPDKLNNKLCLPGGRINFGEDLDKGFIREVKEETGIIIKPLSPFYVWSWKYKIGDDDQQIVAVARLAIYSSGKLLTKKKKESETTIDKPRWIFLNNLELDLFVWDERDIIRKFIKLFQKDQILKSYLT